MLRAQAELKVVFGLDYASPSVWTGNGTDAKWDSSNARALLQWTFEHKCATKACHHPSPPLLSPQWVR